MPSAKSKKKKKTKTVPLTVAVQPAVEIALPNASEYVSFSANQVLNTLADAIEPLVPDNEFQYRRTISDANYIAIWPAALQQLIKTDEHLAPDKYFEDVFDCDDYCFYLRAKCSLLAAGTSLPFSLAVGIILTKEHAFNFCMDPNRTLWVINTQSDDRAYNGVKSELKAFMNLGSNENKITTIYI